MNKVYKVIWSKAKNCYIAVSEIAKSRTKSPSAGVVGAISLENKVAMDLNRGFVAGAFSLDNPVFLSSRISDDFKITVAAIVKNEAENVPQWVQAARSCADEIVVVDTGSTDGTVERFADYGIKCFHYDWHDDFASAKNYMISLCHGDWIVLLDGDEWFRDGCDVRKAIAKHHKNPVEKAIIADWICLDKERNNTVMFSGGAVRAFRNSPEIRYFRKVHENLTINYENFVFEPEFKMYHTGYSGSVNRSKHERNLRIMRTMFDFDNGKVEYPTDWRYIEDTYAGLGQFDKALWAADKMISYGVQDYSAAAWVTKFNVLFAMKTSIEEMRKQFAFCFATVPSVSGFRFLASIYYLRHGLFDEGLDNYIEGLRMLMGPQDKVAMEHTYWRMYLPEATALAASYYLQHGQLEAALLACSVCEQYCGKSNWVDPVFADIRRQLRIFGKNDSVGFGLKVLPLLESAKKGIAVAAMATGLVIGVLNTPNPVSAACVIGGCCNTANATYSVVVSGKDNTTINYTCNNAVIAGCGNKVGGDYALGAAGACNTVGGYYSAIISGQCNSTGACYNLVASGYCNFASADYSGIFGGRYNQTLGNYSVVVGGSNNSACYTNSSVFGGSSNNAYGYGSTVLGGSESNAYASSSIAIGGGITGLSSCSDTARGSIAIGKCATTTNNFEVAIGSACAPVTLGGNMTVTGTNTVTDGTTTKSWTELLSGGSPCFADGVVLAGFDNTASGCYSSVSGGNCNIASGCYSIVAGGCCNTASCYSSSVTGGYHNQASGQYSSVSGGRDQKATGDYSSISGGDSNTASCNSSSVSGGFYNTASGSWSSVTGGQSNTASGSSSSVSGGQYNTASGIQSAVSGGYCNIASGSQSSVSGGVCNTAGKYYSYVDALGNIVYVSPSCSAITADFWNPTITVGNCTYNLTAYDGSHASISGGSSNLSIGSSSSVSGGQCNTASGYASSVSGGCSNIASGSNSSVSGGYCNIASGYASSAIGGCNGFAYACYSTVIGGGIAGASACDQTALGSVAIGLGATTTRDYEVAIGSITAPVKIGGNLTVTGTQTVTDGTNTKTWTDIIKGYTLPAATSSALGGVKIGSNITNSNGTISLTKANVTSALGYTPPIADTDTHYTTHLYVGSGTAANAATTNGNTKIAIADNSTVNNTVTIKGTGATTVTSDANGVITINSTDANTTYSAGNGVSLSGTTFSAKPYNGITVDSNGIGVKAGTNVTVNSNGVSVTGSGSVASGNTGLISGGTLFTEGRITADGTFAKKANSIATNIMALDTASKNAIKGLSVSGTTITYTKGDGTTGTITTQDTNTTYAAGNGVALSGTTFSAKAGTNVSVDSNGINVVGNGSVASGNTGLVSGGTLFTENRITADGTFAKKANTTAANITALDTAAKNSIKGLSVSGQTITYTKGDGTTGTITTQDNNTTYDNMSASELSTGTATTARSISAKVVSDYVTGKVSAETTARTTAINSEATTRANADTALGTRIDNAITAYQSADTGLSNRIGSLSADGNYIKKSATNNVSANLTALDTQLKTTATAVGTETTNRTNADTALSNRIGTLSADGNYIKKSATNNVSANLTALDTQLKTTATAVSTEATTRDDADTALGTRIDNVTSAFESADTELSNRIGTVSANGNYIKASSAKNMAENLGLLDTAVKTNATAISNEVTNRTNAVSSEATARTNADTALGTRIDNVTSAYQSADTALSNRIGSVTSDGTFIKKSSTNDVATNLTVLDTAAKDAIKGLSVSGTTLTYTKGDGTTGTITTQDTDTHYVTGLYVGSGAKANAVTSNGNTKLALYDDNTIRSTLTIVGTGGTTVTSDANGVITINTAELGGSDNNATGNDATISGGSCNTASGTESSVSGGYCNTASCTGTSVTGGIYNEASGDYATVNGGCENIASGVSSSVSGGICNSATGMYATVGGGEYNTASGEKSSVSGGTGNEASGLYSSITGGAENTASCSAASVSGGESNKATGIASTVGGGFNNTASGYASSATGGCSNTASGCYSFVSGGCSNSAVGKGSTVIGGSCGTAYAIDSTVIGGGTTGNASCATSAQGSVAIGSGAVADENYEIAIGSSCAKVSLGGNVDVVGTATVTDGTNTKTWTDIIKGYESMTASELSAGTATTARSISAKVLSDYVNSRIGDSTVSTGSTGSTAVGDSSVVTGNNSVSVGDNSSVTGTGSVSVGTCSSVQGDSNVSIGNNGSVSGSNSVAIGSDSETTESNAVAVGGGSSATGEGAVSLGAGTSAIGDNSTALGNNSYSANDNSVALGSNAVASASDVVSVGHKAGDTDSEGNVYTTNEYRRIINVANGVNANDAATVGQMNTAINTETSARTAADTALGARIDGTIKGLSVNGRTITYTKGDGTTGIITTQDTTYSAGTGLSLSNGAFSVVTDGQVVQGNTGIVTGNIVYEALEARIGQVNVENNAENTVAVGEGSTVGGDGAVAVGTGSAGTGEGSVAIGGNTSADGTGSVAVGDTSSSTGEGSVAVGGGSSTSSDNSVVVGTGSTITGTDSENSVAIGGQTNVTGSDSVALGGGSFVNSSESTALGGNTVVNNDNSVALGYDSNASQDNVVSVGHTATDTNADGTAYGSDLTRRIVNVADGSSASDAATVGQTYVIQNGTNTTVTEAGTNSIGQHIYQMTVTTDGQVTSGNTGIVTGGTVYEALEARMGQITVQNDAQNTVALGDNSSVSGDGAVAVGSGSSGTGVSSVAVGDTSISSGEGSVAVGSEASASSEGAVALGSGSSANSGDSNTNAVAIGNNAQAGTDSAPVSNVTAVGGGSTASADFGTAIGASSIASGTGASAIGQGSAATSSDATAVGHGATATGTDSVALGGGSSVTGMESTAIGGNTVVNNYNSVALGFGSNASTDNVVSVGHKATDKDSSNQAYGTDLFRRIVNVADAVDEHDAVTKGQLDSLMTDSVGSLSSNGNYVLKDNTMSANLLSLDTQLKATDVSSLKYDGADHSLVTMGGTSGTKLTNLKQAALSATSTDAVTGAQLYATNQNISGFANDITQNRNSIREVNSSLSAVLDSVSSYGLYLDTFSNLKADVSLNNLTAAGRQVISQLRILLMLCLLWLLS